MALTSPREVTSGYFRVHSYVTLGLLTLATLVAMATESFSPLLPAVGAICSYLASVFWLYEAPRIGRPALVVVAVASLLGAWQTLRIPAGGSALANVIWWTDPLLGGLVLGLTMAAMLLGHWYLNTPTMKLEPLRRLILFTAVAVLARAVVAATAAGLQYRTEPLDTAETLFLVLRWLSGLLGATGLLWMTWQTMKIPNTQSATGILYVAVIATFLGELTAQLLSATCYLPL
jgi:hypothetical protein